MATSKPTQPELFPQEPKRKGKGGRPSPFTPEQEKQITAEYMAGGLLLDDLVRKWGTYKWMISKVIKRNGGSVMNRIAASRQHKCIFDSDGEQRIREEYEACKNSTLIAKKYGIGASTVLEIVNRAGGKTGRRKHTLNEAAFDDAENNPEAAYWVGFIFADGCVSEASKTGQKRLVVGLNPRDRQQIYNLRSFLQASHAITEGKRLVAITITSDRVVESLGKYGIVPRKSLIAQVPDSMLWNRDFWRGVVDGDGGFHFSKRPGETNITSVITMCGSRHTCECFLQYANAIYQSKGKIRKNKSIWAVPCYSWQACHLALHLYRSGDMALNRKMYAAKMAIELGVEKGAFHPQL